MLGGNYTGCLQLLEILEISWNLLDLLEILCKMIDRIVFRS